MKTKSTLSIMENDTFRRFLVWVQNSWTFFISGVAIAILIAIYAVFSGPQINFSTFFLAQLVPYVIFGVWALIIMLSCAVTSDSEVDNPLRRSFVVLCMAIVFIALEAFSLFLCLSFYENSGDKMSAWFLVSAAYCVTMFLLDYWSRLIVNKISYLSF